MSPQHSVFQMIEVRRWHYLGHTLRKQGSIPHTRFDYAPEWKRRCEIKMSWKMTALEQLQTFDIKSWSEAAEMAKDRLRWREQEANTLARYS